MEELTRKDLRNKALEEAKKMTDKTEELRKALVYLSWAFLRLADAKYLETSLLCKTYFNKEDPEFAEELKGKLSRPIAFGLPEEITEDKLLILVAQTAMDCLEEMELSRQACTLIDPAQVAYSSEFLEKALAMHKNKQKRKHNDDNK